MQLMRLARGFWLLIMIIAFNQILTWQIVNWQNHVSDTDVITGSCPVWKPCRRKMRWTQRKDSAEPSEKNCPTPLKRSNYACMSTKYKIKDEKRQNFMYIQWQYPPIRFKTRLKIRPKMCSIYYHILVGRCKLWRKKCHLYTPCWANGNVDILKLQLWRYPTFCF